MSGSFCDLLRNEDLKSIKKALEENLLTLNTSLDSVSCSKYSKISTLSVTFTCRKALLPFYGHLHAINLTQ